MSASASRGRRLPWPSPTRVAVSLALLGAVAGLALVVATALNTEPALAEQTEARAGSLSLWIESSQWIGGAHAAEDGAQDVEIDVVDHDDEEGEVIEGADGFDRPPTMTPGTPDEGFQRMQVDLTFLNKGANPLDIGPEDFLLEGADGQVWTPLLGGTFGLTTLLPGQTLNTIVAYDVPELDVEQQIDLLWQANGNNIRFTISAPGASHG